MVTESNPQRASLGQTGQAGAVWEISLHKTALASGGFYPASLRENGKESMFYLKSKVFTDIKK